MTEAIPTTGSASRPVATKASEIRAQAPPWPHYPHCPDCHRRLGSELRTVPGPVNGACPYCRKALNESGTRGRTHQ